MDHTVFYGICTVIIFADTGGWQLPLHSPVETNQVQVRRTEEEIHSDVC